MLLKPTKPLKGIVKQLKRKFREEKITKFKPVLVDMAGNTLDEETLPDPDDYDDIVAASGVASGPSGQETVNDAAAVFDPAALKARLVKAASQIKGQCRATATGRGDHGGGKKFRGGDLQGCDTALRGLGGAGFPAGMKWGFVRG